MESAVDRAVAGVFQVILEYNGYPARIRPGHEAATFGILEQQQADLLVAAWLPRTHEAHMEGHYGRVALLSPTYEPYAFWGVPDYVPAEAVTYIDQLSHVRVARQFGETIAGIDRLAHLGRLSRNVIAAYTLAGAGFEWQSQTEAEFARRLDRAFATQEWMVVPLWTPHPLLHQYPVRELKDPLGALGGSELAVPLLSKPLRNRIDEDTFN
jgi:glycine betaine/proline transport system substrate-binding protein